MLKRGASSSCAGRWAAMRERSCRYCSVVFSTTCDLYACKSLTSGMWLVRAELPEQALETQASVDPGRFSAHRRDHLDYLSVALPWSMGIGLLR